MLLWIYISGAIFTYIVAFNVSIRYALAQGWNFEPIDIIEVVLLVTFPALMWPGAIPGFILFKTAEAYANYLNARKNDPR